jgi:hypothetical protein
MQTERNTDLMKENTGAVRLVTDYARPKAEYVHPWYAFKDSIPNSILNQPITLIM